MAHTRQAVPGDYARSLRFPGMAHVKVHAPEIDLGAPVLVEGLPGEGLVGKLVADHLIERLGMTYYAGVYCEGVPPVAAYRSNDSTVRPPVQIYADADRDLLALVSDVPVSPAEAPAFASCVTEWLREVDATPLYLSGLPARVAEVAHSGADGTDGDRAGASLPQTAGGSGSGDGSDAGTERRDASPPPRERELYGLATGDGHRILDDAGIVPPLHAGFVSGPTGALLNRASELELDAAGLVVELGTGVPDVDGARVVLDRGVEPVTGIDVDTDPLGGDDVEVPADVTQFAQQLQEADDGSTRAHSSPMFH